MPFFTGRTGSLRVGIDNASLGALTAAPNTTREVAKIRDWSLDTTVELLSTNSIDSGVNTFTPGVKGATGSATLIYYRLEISEQPTFFSFQQLIGKGLLKTGSITAADRVFFDLNVGTDTAQGVNIDDIKLWGYITSVGISVSTGELSTVPIQFTMDGDFVEIFGEQPNP